MGQKDSLDQVLESRKAAFMRTMKNHPERLKGKTAEEAYQGMRRQVAHLQSTVPGNKNSAPGVQGPVPSRQTAIQRRIQQNNSGTQTRVVNGKTQIKEAGRSDWHYPVNQNLNKPTKRNLPSNPLANKNGKTPYQRLRENGIPNPLANKNGETPLQRLGIGKPAKQPAPKRRTQGRKEF